MPSKITKLTKAQALKQVREDWSKFEQDLVGYEDMLPLITKGDCSPISVENKHKGETL